MDADGKGQLSGRGLCRRKIKCEMGRAFPGYEGGLRPEFRFLKDKAVIIQAWKKAHEYIRAQFVFWLWVK